jgi:5'-phosphate synthase pdxT subunit
MTRCFSTVGVKIGVLALQGDVSEHIDAFRNAVSASGSEASIKVMPVRQKRELETVDLLALPGGESTTISRLIDKNGLFRPLMDFTGGIFATCAGMVVLAREVDDSRVHTLGILDISVKRNAFGRQKESFETDIEISGFDRPFPAVFIRAPVADKVGPGIHVLSSLDVGIVALKQDHHLALSFHPELRKDPRLHLMFLKNCGLV